MAKFRKQIGRWSEADDHALVAEFGAGALQCLVESRVASLMARYAGDRVTVECAPASQVRAAAQRIGVTETCVRNRINTLVYDAMGMSGCSGREHRRHELTEYARRGIRTLAEIRAADAGQTPLAFSAPDPTPAQVAPRTLDTIASELREARATAARLAVECKAAEDRMVALGAEFECAVREVYEP